jgi:hypothetical protein
MESYRIKLGAIHWNPLLETASFSEESDDVGNVKDTGASDRSSPPDPVFHDDPRTPAGMGLLFVDVQRIFRIVGKADAETVRRPEDLGKGGPDPSRPGGRKKLRAIGKL